MPILSPPFSIFQFFILLIFVCVAYFLCFFRSHFVYVLCLLFMRVCIDMLTSRGDSGAIRDGSGKYAYHIYIYILRYDAIRGPSVRPVHPSRPHRVGPA